MTRRLLAILTIPVVLAAAAMTVQTALAQSAPVAATSHSAAPWTLDRHLELVRAVREQTGVTANWKPKRTTWGHPDFEGAWTSDAVHGVPRDRPAQFAFLNDAEFADRVASEAKTRQDALIASGAGTAGRDRAWRGDITFRLTSLIVDPPNGRMPAVTPRG
jgi:hypothetical protein